MGKYFLKTLRGMPLHLQGAEGIKFGKTELDYLCINMSPVCNYRCKKCFTWASKHKLENFIGVPKIKEIINKGKEMGVKTVGILGEGEPLLFPKIKEIIIHINELSMIPLIATNGSLLTKEMVDFLYANGVSIALSLDTLDEKEYKELVAEIEYCKSLIDLEEILWTVGQEEYDADNNNCLHFSQNLKSKLEEKGIRSSIVKGTWGDRNHYWVLIWVESTEGDFVKPDEDYILEKIID